MGLAHDTIPVLTQLYVTGRHAHLSNDYSFREGNDYSFREGRRPYGLRPHERENVALTRTARLGRVVRVRCGPAVRPPCFEIPDRDFGAAGGLRQRRHQHREMAGQLASRLSRLPRPDRPGTADQGRGGPQPVRGRPYHRRGWPAAAAQPGMSWLISSRSRVTPSVRPPPPAGTTHRWLRYGALLSVLPGLV